MRAIVFKGKCTDPSWDYEHLYMKEVEGYDIIQEVYKDELIEMRLNIGFNQEVIIDPKSLQIEIDKEFVQNIGNIGNNKIGGLIES